MSVLLNLCDDTVLFLIQDIFIEFIDLHLKAKIGIKMETRETFAS